MTPVMRRGGRGARLYLRTLGPIALEGPPGVDTARVLAQPKRLAVLAYLVARPFGEAVRRDRIVATFWPELPAARANANLRNTLYFLRTALGRDLLDDQGDAISVSPAALECDAAILLAAGEDAPADDLLQLYGGDFLDALHVSAAPDFERWVDRMRAALRARAADLAWRLSFAAEAAEEWITAARYARRAAELAVDVEGATQRLIRLLDRAGDRAAALAAYEQLSARLRTDYEVTPSPETTSLMEQVRARGADLVAHGEEPRPRFRSLAVLPFDDLGGGAGVVFANGMSEEVLTSLAAVRGVRVVSRTSIRRFAERRPASMRAVRELLDVDLVLEGSVRIAGDRVRVTVQLIDAARDAHLWADTYDRQLDDVFAVQSDVAMRVARALETELSPREHDRLRRAPTASLEAWQFYLKGRELWSHRNPHDAERATVLFRRSLERDAAFPQAWVGLADAHLVRAATGGGSLHEAHREARAAIDRALALDPENGEAHATLGLLLAFLERDHAAAEKALRRAVEYSPGHAPAHQWYGMQLIAHGRIEEGLDEVRLARTLDPLSPAVNEALGLALYHAGRREEAIDQLEHTLELDPAFWRARIPLAFCRFDRADGERAIEQLVTAWRAGAFGAPAAEARAAERRRSDGVDPVLDYLAACAERRAAAVPAIRMLTVPLFVQRGRSDEALAALAAAKADRSLGFVVMYAPALDPLAADARFRRLMRESGLLLPRWRGRP